MMYSNTSNGDNTSSKRRDVLKKGALGIVGTATIPSLGTASGQRRTHGKGAEEETPYERSLRLRRQNGWSHAEWQSFLEDTDHYVGKRERSVSVPVQTNSDDVSAQLLKYDSYECTITMTYTYPRYHSDFDIIQLEWEHEPDWNDAGGYPNDNGAISWDSDHYTPTTSVDDWVYYHPDYTMDPDDVDSKTPSGTVCDWGDVPDDDHSWFGVRVEPNTDEYDYSERIVYFDYVHTYSGNGLAGVSIGPSGLSLQFSSNTKRWDIEDEASEEQLLDGETESG